MTKRNPYPSSWRRLYVAAYRHCRDTDGELCARCHKRPVKKGQSISDPLSQCPSLEVDHIDSDKSHNPIDGSNWQLLCHRCNCIKRSQQLKNHGTRPSPSGPPIIAEREREGERGKESERNRFIVKYMEMEKNLQAEGEFHRFVDTQIKRMGSIKKRVLLDAAANDFRIKTENTISQQALSRYLDKRTNELNGDLIQFRDAEEEWAIKLRF